MLAEINLLPQKEKKSKSLYFFIAFLTIVIIVAAIVFYLLIQDKKQQLTSVENQITQTNFIIETQKKKLAEYKSSDSIKNLEVAIDWANTQPVNIVYILQELTRLLPKRGFIEEFEINEENSIEQIVQFDTKSEAAYYLHSLLSLEWIDEAVINEAKTSDILKDNEDNQVKKSDILPRYYAKYELKINIPLLKASYDQNANKENNDQAEEQGGDTP